MSILYLIYLEPGCTFARIVCSLLKPPVRVYIQLKWLGKNFGDIAWNTHKLCIRVGAVKHIILCNTTEIV